MRKLKWLDGYLLLDSTFEYLSVNGVSGSIEVKPKTIIVKGVDEYIVSTTPREHYVCLHLRKELKPFSGSSDALFNIRDLSMKIEWIKTSIGEYYVILLPQHFNTKFLIIAEDEVCVAIDLKKKFNVETVDDAAILYIY